MKSKIKHIIPGLVLLLCFAACIPPTTPPPAPTPAGPVTDPQGSKDKMELGILYLKDHQWENAYDSFTEAVLKDPGNGEAQVWYSMVDIASIAVDANLVELLQNRLGFIGYPADMDTLYSANWVDMEILNYYDPWEGIAHTMLLPEISVPNPITIWEDQNPDVITFGEYILAFFYNFVTANPNGFNPLVDGVIGDVLGPRLDRASSILHNVPDDMHITFTWDMFSTGTTPPASWPCYENGQPLDIIIGKGELLIEVAALQSIRSLLTLFRSYNLTLPLVDYYNAFNPLDGTYGSNTLDWGDLVTPMAAEFMFQREGAQVILNEARAAMLSALEHASNGIAEILSNRPGMTLAADSPLFATNPESWDQVEGFLNFQQILCTKLTSSLRDNQTIILPLDFRMAPETFFSTYADENNWPQEGLWDSEGSYGPEYIYLPVNLSTLYSGCILALDTLFELQANGEPAWYRCDYTVENPTDTPSAATTFRLDTGSPVDTVNPAAVNVFYALKIRDLTLGGLFTPTTGMLVQLETFIRAQSDILGLADEILQENSDGSISLFIPFVPPCFAYESFAASGELLYINYPYMPDSYYYTTRGSFIWALPDIVEFMNYRIQSRESLNIGTPYTIDALLPAEERLLTLSVTPGTLYTFKLSNVQGYNMSAYIYDSVTQENYLGNLWAEPDYPGKCALICNTEYLYLYLTNYTETSTSAEILVETAPVNILNPGAPPSTHTIAASGVHYFSTNVIPGLTYALNISDVTNHSIDAGIYEGYCEYYYMDNLVARPGISGTSVIFSTTGSLFIAIKNNAEVTNSFELSLEETSVPLLEPGTPQACELAANATAYYSLILNPGLYTEISIIGSNISLQITAQGYSMSGEYQYRRDIWVNSGEDASIYFDTGYESVLLVITSNSDMDGTLELVATQ